MPRKWTRQDWYYFHRNKAEKNAPATYAAAEHAARAEVDRRVEALKRELVARERSQGGLLTLLSYVLPIGGGETLARLREELERVKAEQLRVYEATAGAIRAAQERGLSEYEDRRALRTEQQQLASERSHERYLARSPGIRAAQPSIKEQMISEAKATGMLSCYYCKVVIADGDVQLDHKMPIVRGGSNNRSNLALTCSLCNFRKGRKSEAEFRRFLDEQE